MTYERWKSGVAVVRHWYLPNRCHCCELPQAMTALAEPELF